MGPRLERAASIEIGTKIRSTRHQEELLNNWEDLKQCFMEKLAASAERETRDSFLQVMHAQLERGNGDYIETVLTLAADDAVTGTAWLHAIVDLIVDTALDIIPSYKP